MAGVIKNLLDADDYRFEIFEGDPDRIEEFARKISGIKRHKMQAELARHFGVELDGFGGAVSLMENLAYMHLHHARDLKADFGRSNLPVHVLKNVKLFLGSMSYESAKMLSMSHITNMNSQPRVIRRIEQETHSMPIDGDRDGSMGHIPVARFRFTLRDGTESGWLEMPLDSMYVLVDTFASFAEDYQNDFEELAD